MGDHSVELGRKELERIGEYVRAHLAEWMGELRRDRELELTERVVRVEEELKSLREVMEARFESVDERFKSIDSRFDTMERRFSSLQWTMGLGFTLLAALMGLFNFV
jgi:hypothetical protein